jgi:peptidoglycan/xylan/chitin deacetylase (PgdA/CDA1 family)
MKENIPILNYHFIKEPLPHVRIKGLYTSAKQFDWQIKRLINNDFTFITFKDIVEENYNPTKRNIILTFDDGCESFYLNAFSILKKYGIKGVFYIVANSIGEENVVWEQNENNEPIDIVSKQQLIEMSTYGIEIGSHLCHHVHLDQLSLPEIKFELTVSKRLLENELGKQIYSVAYPFGSYNDDVLVIAEEAGYKYGVTTKNGNNRLAKNLELFRISVKGYSFRHYWYFYKTLRRILK